MKGAGFDTPSTSLKRPLEWDERTGARERDREVGEAPRRLPLSASRCIDSVGGGRRRCGQG